MGNEVSPAHCSSGGTVHVKCSRPALAHKQDGGTCYANAIATAIRATESRIVGRRSESHDVLKNQIIRTYGSNGANTWKVLQAECKKRHLQCEAVTEDEAMQSLLKNRVIVCRFRLDDDQWARFSQYFEQQKKGILTSSVLGKASGTTGGHAVCIIGYNPIRDCWKVQNSWGGGFADNGYFRVERGAFSNAHASVQFIDVYYRVCDLTQTDLANYKRMKEWEEL